MQKKPAAIKPAFTRRKFLSDIAVLGAGAAAGSGLALPAWAQKKSTKTGIVRVWGEPGPYGGVAVDASIVGLGHFEVQAFELGFFAVTRQAPERGGCVALEANGRRSAALSICGN